MAEERKYWLMKSEPDVYSIDDLKRDKTTHWDGVRNFKARNYMRDMRVGDKVFFYHSNVDPKGIFGIAKVSKKAYPDHTQFDKRSKYYDARASKEKPYWYMVDIKFVSKFKRPVTLDEMKGMAGLKGMALLKRGQRLSVQPVTAKQWAVICRTGGVRP